MSTADASSWILGSRSKELSLIYLPGLIATILGMIFLQQSVGLLLWTVVTLAVIDSGHIYTTLWRSFWRREEYQSNRQIYLAITLGCFALFLLWQSLGLPYLWSFVLYATAFHNIRQFYGFSRWYEKLNKRTDRFSGYFLYALTVFPLLLYHFRQNVPAGIYSSTDLFVRPNPFFFLIGINIYYLVIGIWLGYELYLRRKGFNEWNRVMSIAYPAFLYGFGFLHGHTVPQILFPILAGHGIPYFAVMSLSMNRLDRARFPSFSKAYKVILFTAIGFGAVEFFAERSYLVCDNGWSSGRGLLATLLTAAYLVPLFCHYVFDAFLWTGKHRESKIVFQAN